MSRIFLVDLESVETRYTGEWKTHVPALLRKAGHNVMTDRGWSWCMCRGCIFPYNGEPIWKLSGRMVYDPDFRYVLTGETVDPRAWKPEKNKDRKDIKSRLGYSRIGLGNI